MPSRPASAHWSAARWANPAPSQWAPIFSRSPSTAFAFGQIAAISFGALVVSQEFHNAAVRVSLAAVPRRGVFYAAKMITIGVATLAVGVITGFATIALSPDGAQVALFAMTVPNRRDTPAFEEPQRAHVMFWSRSAVRI